MLSFLSLSLSLSSLSPSLSLSLSLRRIMSLSIGTIYILELRKNLIPRKVNLCRTASQKLVLNFWFSKNILPVTVESLLEDAYWIPNITNIMYNKPLTREHPLYNGRFLLVPMVSALERFNCIQKRIVVSVLLLWFHIQQVALATFATYAIATKDSTNPDDRLTADRAFVALSLFNILRFPLLMLPNLITMLVQVGGLVGVVWSFF